MSDKRFHKIALAVWAVMLALTMLFLFGGCSQVRYVPIETTRTQTDHDTLLCIDSIYLSRFVYIKGDTIHEIDTIYRWRVKEKIVETCRVDSIPYAVEVVKEVPRERSGYDRFTSWAFWIILALVAAYFTIKILLNRSVLRYWLK